MTTKKSAIKSAVKQANANLRSSDAGSIGDMVWSDPVSGWTHPAHLVQAAFTKHGLDPLVFLPSAPDYGTAFSRSILAVRTAIQGRGYTLLAAGYGENGESRYSVLAVSRNGHVETADVACVQCPKDGTAPFIERCSPNDEGANDIAQLIVQASKQRYQTYTSDDVRQAFLQMLRLYHAQSTRTSAPHTHFFLLSAGSSPMRTLAQALAEVGWGEIHTFEGAMTQANLNTVESSVNKGLEAEIQAYAQEVTTFLATETERGRDVAIQRKIDAGEALKEKADMYRSILGQGIDSLDEQVAAINAEITAAMRA